MLQTRISRVLAFLLFTIAVAGPQPSQAAGREDVLEDARMTLKKAVLTVESFAKDPSFLTDKAYVRESYGVLIVPSLVKAGIGIGGQGGSGVLFAHDPETGRWSAPAFFGLGGPTLGPQLGVERLELVFVILDQGALSAILSGDFKLGVDASFVAGSGGGRAESTTGDIRVLSRSEGVYAGATLKGTSVSPKDHWNLAFYGRATTPSEIVRTQQVVTDPSVEELRAALSRF